MDKCVLCLVLIAGCGDSSSTMMDMAPAGPPRLVDAATLAAVSSDQKYLAYYTQAGLLANGQPTVG